MCCWTNPFPRNPEDTVTCDVWFSEDYPEYGKYDGDPNFLNYATKVVDNEAVSSVALDFVTIVPEHYYYWRVDCYDPNYIGILNFIQLSGRYGRSIHVTFVHRSKRALNRRAGLRAERLTLSLMRQ